MTTLLKECYESRKGERMNEDRFVYAPSERADYVNLHHRLVPQGGGRKGQTPRMDDLGKISGPKNYVASNITQLPVQRMDPQNYEEERIK